MAGRIKKILINASIHLLIIAIISIYVLIKYLSFAANLSQFGILDQWPIGKYFFACQYDFVFLAILVAGLIIAAYSANRFVKIILPVSGFLILFVLLLDCALQALFSTRLLFFQIRTFTSNLESIFDFMIYFSTKLYGKLTYTCLFLWCLCGFLVMKTKVTKNYLVIAVTLLFSFCVLFFNSKDPGLFEFRGGKVLFVDLSNKVDREVTNNLFVLNKDSKQISFSQDFVPAGYELKVNKYGQKKKPVNIILVIIESLNAGNSFLLSGLHDFTPNLDNLAKQGQLYKNYFSNNVASAESQFSLLTGYVYQNFVNGYQSKELYQHNFIKYLNDNGVKTILYSSADDIGGINSIYKNVSFQKHIDNNDPFYSNAVRYIFNSIDDRTLYAKVLEDIKTESQEEPNFRMVVTTTSHRPYVVPDDGRESYYGTIRYADREVYKFIQELKEQNFFENGIILITGDHHAMLPFEKEELAKYNLVGARFRVPLIIYGRDIEPKIVDTYLDHSSLGPLIEYLQVGEYEVNQFQADPLNPDPHRIIMAADERPQWFFLLDPNGQERKFHYDGDVLVDEVREKMNNPAVNWEEYVKYLAWLRQNF